MAALLGNAEIRTSQIARFASLSTAQLMLNLASRVPNFWKCGLSWTHNQIISMIEAPADRQVPMTANPGPRIGSVQIRRATSGQDPQH
jgi:hypothetical protein